MQDVLDHTSTRIIEQSQESVTEAVKGTQEGDDLKLTLVCKWGFDGASGHSAYKQTFSSPQYSDESLFSTTLVPLQLKSANSIIWQNPVPSSTRFCRPLHLQFEKESTELCLQEELSIKQQTDQLQPTHITVITSDTTESNIQVFYDLHHTMVDQKVINSLTQTSSSMRCYICGATPKQFNNLQDLYLHLKRTHSSTAFHLSISGSGVLKCSYTSLTSYRSKHGEFLLKTKSHKTSWHKPRNIFKIVSELNLASGSMSQDRVQETAMTATQHEEHLPMSTHLPSYAIWMNSLSIASI